jgi:hypothetical protein
MKWVLEKKRKYDEGNYFHQFRNFNISIEEQLQELEDLKQTLPIDEHFGIDLQKHFLMISELIEAGNIVPHDECREQYIEPAADRLHESAMKLCEHFFGKLENL